VPPFRAAFAGEGGDPEQVRAEAATTNLFALLGARLQLGRDFTDEDGAPQPPNPPGAAPAPNAAPRLPAMLVLSYPFWQRKFGGDPGVVGRTVDFGGGRGEIIGVLAPGFELLFPPRAGFDPAVDVWSALRLDFNAAARNTGVLRVIGRLKPGVPIERAQAEAEGIAATLRERYQLKKNANVHFRVVPMHDDLVREVRPSILALVGAVVFVLLIACANVANLLIVRAASRRRELVIRAAIGGSRSRLLRQLLTESLILAGAGALAGLALAQGGIDLLLAMAPAKLPRIDAVAINPAVLAFTAGAALVTAVVCGIVPAIRASRPDVIDVLRMTGAAPGLRAGRALRSGVVVAEVALSFVLLVGSGLMLRTFVALQRVDPGFDPAHVLTFTFQAPQRVPEERAVFLRRVAERLRALPGVEGVTAANPLPLDGGILNVPWATEADASDPAGFRQANFHVVRPGYFETLRTRLIAGRTFTDDDDHPQTDRVVIDDVLAARAFPNQPAVGRTLVLRNLRANGPNAPQNERVQVIGVVAHQRHESLLAPGREAIFLVDQYLNAGFASRWAVRTSGDPVSLALAVKAAIAALDAGIPLAEMQPMTAFVDKSTAPTRFAVVLIGVFAVVAVALAAVGLYGVVSTVVRQRTAEIGMRVVFGASRGSIFRLIVAEGLRLSAAGVALGLAAALGITGVMRTMLVSVTPTDPATFATITVLFFTIAALACWVPARRAARLDPVAAFRE